MSRIFTSSGHDRRAGLAAAIALLAATACSCSDSKDGTTPPAAPVPGAAGTSNAGGNADGVTPNEPGGSAPLGSGGVVQTGGAGGTAASGAAGTAAESPDSKPPAPSGDPAVRFVGRFDTADTAGPRFAWSGSGIIARFSGTSVGVRLGGGQEYTVVIDGVVQPKLISTGNLDSLASALPAGEHTVELYRRTEANEGEAQFLGFDFGAGALLAPPPAPERRIEIIGDSISAGYGNEGADMNCPFSRATENHYMTYGAIAARNVGADLVTVAWSGRGVVCNYGDEPTACENPMPTVIDRTLPARADSTWDYSRYLPQAVVINLGTNDFSTDVDPATTDFEAAYVTLLARVRTAYPDATILATVGPLLSGTDLTTARTSIQNAVQTRQTAGDEKVTTFELAPTDAANGYGCDWHPSIATHEVMAETLTLALEAELGWAPLN